MWLVQSDIGFILFISSTYNIIQFSIIQTLGLEQKQELSEF